MTICVLLTQVLNPRLKRETDFNIVRKMGRNSVRKISREEKSIIFILKIHYFHTAFASFKMFLLISSFFLLLKFSENERFALDRRPVGRGQEGARVGRVGQRAAALAAAAREGVRRPHVPRFPARAVRRSLEAVEEPGWRRTVRQVLCRGPGRHQLGKVEEEGQAGTAGECIASRSCLFLFQRLVNIYFGPEDVMTKCS